MLLHDKTVKRVKYVQGAIIQSIILLILLSIFLIAKISNTESLLSSVPSIASQVLLLLPKLLVPPATLVLQHLRPQLSETLSELFNKGLFSCIQLDTQPIKIQYCCLQPGCRFLPPAKDILYSTTSNLWIYYKQYYNLIWKLYKNSNTQLSISSSSSCSSPANSFSFVLFNRLGVLNSKKQF
jgi:hypothetical protein